MRIIDLVKTSQTNLFRAKLRTSLTIIAVFVGAFTVSVTNGVGQGVKSYVDTQLGNVGVENAFLVQARTEQPNPFSGVVVEYDPEVRSGIFNNTLLTARDIEKIGHIKNVQKITPHYMIRIDFISATDKKYKAQADQYTEGLNLDMAAGRVVDVQKADETVIPIRYVSPLGFADAENAVGKNLVMGYRNAAGEEQEKKLTIVGVAEESILGSSAVYISPLLAGIIFDDQASGFVGNVETHDSFIVEFDPNLSAEERNSLRDLLIANNYTAQTIQDQIGTFSQIIDGILAGLNVFGIIALFVATFGIINTLLMSVNERTSEIGLMKALGANSRTIFGIFSMEAASIGFWGAVLGISASMVVGTVLNAYAANNFLSDFPGFNLLAFPIHISFFILAGIVLLAFLAGTLPSLKASRLDPIKALRYE